MTFKIWSDYKNDDTIINLSDSAGTDLSRVKKLTLLVDDTKPLLLNETEHVNLIKNEAGGVSNYNESAYDNTKEIEGVIGGEVYRFSVGLDTNLQNLKATLDAISLDRTMPGYESAAQKAVNDAKTALDKANQAKLDAQKLKLKQMKLKLKQMKLKLKQKQLLI